jgi:signal transduction histidine kinase
MSRNGARPRILLVDDEPMVLESLATHLRGDWDVLTAGGGEEATDILWDETDIHVIVSDLMMQGMRGYTFLAKAWAIAPDATRILLSGHGSLETALSAVNEGHVFRILMKPCRPSTFRAAVEDGLEQYRMVTGDRRLLQKKLETLKNQLLRAEKMASLGTMAGAVGHELNNIAMVLKGNLDLAKLGIEAGRPLGEELFAELDRVTNHLATHASELQRLGKPGFSQVDGHDLRDIVSETVNMLRNVGFIKRAGVRVDLPGNPVPIYADRTRLEQVLINLLKNAADAVAPIRGKAPEISVSVLNEAHRGWALTEVTDNGVGILEDDLESVFEPYFSRKNEDDGTGLGLPVCRQILDEAGGRLRVTSEEGVGSTFTFSLPMSEREVAASR